VLISSRAKQLGTKGDVLLLDPSAYVLGVRAGISIQRSEHVFFATDGVAVRARWRGDGAPFWSSARTLVNGTDTVSPFVVLATRA
jgi:HK97 family phage major capsid protein